MRSVNSMIAFRQIVPRVTRLFDGKDYCTLYDFVGAHKHFHDPEWDGDALPCEICGEVSAFMKVQCSMVVSGQRTESLSHQDPGSG